MCFVTNHFNSTDMNDSYSRICGEKKLNNSYQQNSYFALSKGKK